MSERGSFVTEYMYCHRCFEETKKVLTGVNKEYLYFQQISDLPILAGKIRGMYAGEEVEMFESEIVSDLENALCHPVRVAVIADYGERIFQISPGE